MNNAGVIKKLFNHSKMFNLFGGVDNRPEPNYWQHRLYKLSTSRTVHFVIGLVIITLQKLHVNMNLISTPLSSKTCRTHLLSVRVVTALTRGQVEINRFEQACAKD